MKRISIRKLNNTLDAAEYLLGKLLVVNSPEGHFSGIITETEAYLSNDPASHSCKGKTNRNRDMFLPSGHIYIYTIYGMYNCLNIVTAREGVGEAVLVRSVRPVTGIKKMMELRHTDNLFQLTSGPGKLVQAVGLSKTDSGARLFDGVCSVYDIGYSDFEIIHTGRIGITQGKELLYRMYISSETDYVSVSKLNKKLLR